MKEIAVLGNTEFNVGFRLCGIKKVIPASNSENLDEQVKNILKDAELGIVIIDEESISKITAHLREDMRKSLSPVFVIVSATSAQEELRRMIIQSVGVDLLKQ